VAKSSANQEGGAATDTCFPGRTTWRTLLAKHVSDGLIVVGILAYCLLFPQFTTVTGDDFNSLLDSSANHWEGGNRPWWIVTAPVAEGITRWLLETRWVYGVHVLAAFIPALVLSAYLSKRGLQETSRIGILLLLATKVVGQEHSAPLSYPVSYSVALGLTMAGGLYCGVDGKWTTKYRIRKYLTAAASIVPSLWYEYYPLIFCTCCLWATFDRDQRIRKRDLILATLPITALVAAKLLGYIIAGGSPGFNSYDGTQLGTNPASLEYAARSFIIAAQMLAGNTIWQHTDKLMTWPPLKNISSPSIASWMYAALISAGFATAIQRGSSLHREKSEQSKHFRVNALIALTFLTVEQLLLHSISGKYHSWFADLGFGSGNTYLNGSLAMTPAAYLLALVSTETIRKCTFRANQLRIRGGVIAIFSLAIAVSAESNYRHNSQVGAVMKKRARNLESIVSLCPDWGKSGQEYESELRMIFPVDPSPAVEPLYLDKRGSRTTGEAICKVAKREPRLFRNWYQKEVSNAERFYQNIGGSPFSPNAQQVLEWIIGEDNSKWFSPEGSNMDKRSYTWSRLGLGQSVKISLPRFTGGDSSRGAIFESGIRDEPITSLPYKIFIEKAPGYQKVKLNIKTTTSKPGRVVQLDNEKILLYPADAMEGTLIIAAASARRDTSDKPQIHGIAQHLSSKDTRRSFFKLIVRASKS
jgi:hypothetical protein